MWACLNLSASSRFGVPLFRAAVAKAGGQLRALDISVRGLDFLQRLGLIAKDFDRELLEAVAANAATLTDLRIDTEEYSFSEEVHELIQAATALSHLQLSVVIDDNEDDRQVARAMLRNEPPFQVPQLRELSVRRRVDNPADLVAFCSDLRCHASLEGLCLSSAALDTAAAMGAVVDACIALRLRSLGLQWCHVIPAVLPELIRLIAAGALRWLIVRKIGEDEMFDETHESTRLFVAAVRASAMTRLQLEGFGVLPESVVEAAAFINARQQ